MRERRVERFVQAEQIFKATPRRRQRKLPDPGPQPPNQQEIDERFERNIAACKEALRMLSEKDKSN